MRRRFRIATRTYDHANAPAISTGERWDLAVVGEDWDLDARSRAAHAYASDAGSTTLSVRFDSSVNQHFVNGQAVSFGRLCTQFAGKRTVLIEATTLNFPEILYVVTAALRQGIAQLRLVYVEPVEYRRSIVGTLCEHRDFNLSSNRRYRSIPHFITNLGEMRPGQAVFFLGYEGARFGQALEQEEVLQKWKKHVVFGVPAFEAGWETDSMANNVQHLDGSVEVRYAAAASAFAAYDLLCGLRVNDKESNPVLVAPLGTKPHAIGTTLFLIEHESMEQAVLLYDHPARSKERSLDVRRWHFFDVADTGHGWEGAVVT